MELIKDNISIYQNDEKNNYKKYYIDILKKINSQLENKLNINFINLKIESNNALLNIQAEPSNKEKDKDKEKEKEPTINHNVNKKNKEHEALIQTLKDNELNKIRKAEQLKKEKEEDLKFCEENNKVEERKELERKLYFKRIERNAKNK